MPLFSGAAGRPASLLALLLLSAFAALSLLPRAPPAPAGPHFAPQLPAADLRAAKARVEASHGPWTAHAAHLGHGVRTLGEGPNGNTFRVRRFLQLAHDLLLLPSGSRWEDLRVLDLACLEGLYAAEFAAKGARALGVEIREASLAKAIFMKDALGLRTLEFRRDDVRNVARGKYGEFDVVVCSGILYHLEAADAVKLLRNLAGMTRMLIVDTRTALRPETNATLSGRTYWGSNYAEHATGTPEDKKKGQLWASIDNENAFWFTRASLARALSDAGFASVLEVHAPETARKFEDRITMVALGRKRMEPELQGTEGKDPASFSAPGLVEL
ncbi:S-adenosyl-L-methionine-dependent methyltransferase [Hyaloraphidium curvatum]|nr:S-adenosyl-L-methionine-dependent methyltransferase [Hyaloraphidium curvatum]